MTKKIDPEEAAQKLPAPWRIIDGKPVARWQTDSFKLGAEFLLRWSGVADELNHHPDVLVTYPSVEVTTISHDVDGITERELALAEKVCRLAGEMSLASAAEKTRGWKQPIIGGRHTRG